MDVAWIARHIEHFEQEEKIFNRTRSYSRAGSSFESGNGGDGSRPWGPYDRQPCRKEPVGSVHIRWIYIVDLDNKCLVVRTDCGSSRQFKLENPPRHLFEQDIDTELMEIPISLQYLYEAAPAIGYNPVDLARFAEFAPRQYTCCRERIQLRCRCHYRSLEVVESTVTPEFPRAVYHDHQRARNCKESGHPCFYRSGRQDHRRLPV